MMTRSIRRAAVARFTLAAVLAASAVAALGVASRGRANAACGVEKPSLEDLAFMVGSWEGKLHGGAAVVEEHWIPASGGAMLAMNRTVAGEKMVAFEFLRIVERPSGIVYVAQPNGGKPTEFTLTKLEGESVTFENPAHDFPKAIAYEKKKDGSLVATVSGDGKSEVFPFQPAAKKK